LRAGGQGSGIQEALRLYGRAAYRFSRPVQLVMTVQRWRRAGGNRRTVV